MGRGRPATAAQKAAARRAARTENDGPVKSKILKTIRGSRKQEYCKCARCGKMKYRFVVM